MLFSKLKLPQLISMIFQQLPRTQLTRTISSDSAEDGDGNPNISISDYESGPNPESDHEPISDAEIPIKPPHKPPVRKIDNCTFDCIVFIYYVLIPFTDITFMVPDVTGADDFSTQVCIATDASFSMVLDTLYSVISCTDVAVKPKLMYKLMRVKVALAM
jgi:hypothetical protein